MEFPAVADFECTTALVEAAKSIGATTHVGVTASSDTFYPGQERYDTFSGRVVSRFKGSMEEWQSMGVMNYEMESATLLTMCASQGLRAGMVAGVIVNRTQQEIPNAETMKQTESHAVKIVVEAARRLL
jgi:uridine phosphorylase